MQLSFTLPLLLSLIPLAASETVTDVGTVSSVVESTITSVVHGSTITYTSYYTTVIITQTVHVKGKTNIVTKYGDRPTSTLSPSNKQANQIASPSSNTGPSSKPSSVSFSTTQFFETMNSVPSSASAYSSTSSDNTCFFYFDLEEVETSTITSTKYVTKSS